MFYFRRHWMRAISHKCLLQQSNNPHKSARPHYPSSDISRARLAHCSKLLQLDHHTIPRQGLERRTSGKAYRLLHKTLGYPVSDSLVLTAYTHRARVHALSTYRENRFCFSVSRYKIYYCRSNQNSFVERVNSVCGTHPVEGGESSSCP